MKSFLILIVLSSILFFGCKEEQKEVQVVKVEKEPLPVEVMNIGRTKIQKRVSASSTIRPDKEVYIVSETGGKITSVNFKMGDFIEKDFVLLTVENEIQVASVEMAKSNLETAELSLKIAEELFSTGNSSEIELASAKNQYIAAKTGLVQAEDALDNCLIKAPFSGYIISKEASIENGGMIAPGSLIGRIIDINKVYCEFQVGENEVSIVKKGQKVEVEIPAINEVISDAEVVAISYGADQRSGTFPVKVKWSNKDLRVLAGMSANLNIVTSTEDSPLVVTDFSIFENNNKKAVYIDEKGNAALRYIETGRSSGNLIEVTSGVSENELLVVSGYTVIKSGDPIKSTNKGVTGEK
ncbi:MAG: efflux RND transporter periplasmic adaptor subunit [Candidatus Delongbacteria bacterium]|nr:efflux RND transporter periplasmic adaptor subunit [Candidatus Delongbacteria bacterium]MBN2833868.1 efflux RND transporter periplasmic adaptor subunit [Candidatus Delongbacteria bacterium]